jgi:acyl-CoA synthetase (AMP-forming)/AMP-acid ligase II/thioesterase domain-containing protein/acyl carrier protein
MHWHLGEMVASAAARHPHQPLYTFLHSDREDQTVSAAQLHRDAGLAAALLRENGVKPGMILPLVFDHGYELVAAFWAAVYLGAVPTIMAYLPRESRSRTYLERLAQLVRFTGAETVVTTGAIEPYLRPGLAQVGCRILVFPEPWIADAHLTGAALGEPVDPPYIQFSSGTTGLPKGVRLSHAALIEYCRVSSEHFVATIDDVTVGWLPLYHDMGLANQIFEPLVVPRHSVLISPAAWLSEPHRLLTAIDRFRGSITWMPNFAFRYCTRRIRDEQITGLDLSSWRVVGNASEPVLVEDLRAFAARFGPYGVRETALTVSYGMAEHVAGMTWTAHDRAPRIDWVSVRGLEEGKAVPAVANTAGSRAIVSCGEPLSEVALRIVDDTGRDLAEREIGEILATGPFIFKGYYAMPEESAAALRDGWLHTGDLGYLADGELHLCGRKKDLIIVGGRNLHPHQLEEVAAAVLADRVRLTAAFGVPNPQLGTEMPIIVCEMRQVPDAASGAALERLVREHVREMLQVFVGDVYFVDKGWIVRSTSGKINRAANRAKYLSERSPRESPTTTVGGAVASPDAAASTEDRLVRIWRELFDQAQIDRDADFFKLGGDSLQAAELSVAVEEEFHRSLPATALIAAPTLRALALLLEDTELAVSSRTLVALQPATASLRRPIFFCVHGLGGGVLDYRPLSQALGPEQPFYGLQARGVDGEGPIDDSIEAMAAHYIETIRPLQSHGPYYLGGYCFGGVVAYEMARQITAAAERVALVAILEGYAPIVDGTQNRMRREWRFLINFVRSLPYWLRDYRQLGHIQRQARTRRIMRVAKKRIMRLAGIDVELEIPDMLDGVGSLPAHIQRVLETHLGATRRYTPTPYAGRVVLFRTPHTVLQAPEEDRGWGELTTEPVDVQMIAGSHGTILQEPHVAVLAEKLRAFLR